MSEHPTTTILLVRHAESEANAAQMFGSQLDSKLTERGRLQSAALARALASVRIDHVYSSDLSRARDTVRPVAESRGLSLLELAAFRERSVGELMGLSFREARERYPEAWQALVKRDPDARPPGGESLRDLQERVGAALESVLEARRGSVIAIGSHGVAIYAMVRYLLGLRDPRTPLVLAVNNASVSRVDLIEHEGMVAPRLVYANRVAPLEGEGPFD